MVRPQSLWTTALAALAPSVVLAKLQFPAEGEMSIVFPRNETYGVVSPFPIIFGYRNAPVLLSSNSRLRWNIDCVNNTFTTPFTAEDNIVNGYDGATLPAEPYFALNSTRTANEVTSGPRKDPNRDFGRMGEEDRCTLSWTFAYSTICRRLKNGGLLIQSGLTPKKGSVVFTIRPGAILPHEAIAKYEGCPVAAFAERVKSLTETFCPDEDKSPELQPCKLDVKAVASSLASAIKPATTTFTGAPTSTTASSQSTSTLSGESGGGSNGGSGNKSSAAAGLSIDVGIGLMIGILMI